MLFRKSSPAWSKALTGVSFTRAYDDEGGTEDTTERSHRQHYQLLPRAQWEGEDRGMGTSDEGAGESQNQDVFEWCEEDRCRLYEANEGWRSDTRDFTISQPQRGAKDGFNIIVITQSAQSPDFNYCDLAFFNSLNSDVRIQSMSNRAEIIEAVEKCFAEYGAERMAGCTRSLTFSYRGCLETGGNNTYKTHRGVAKNARNGVEDFAVTKSVVDKARKTLAQLKAAGDDPAPTPGAPTPTLTDQELGLDFGRFSETSSSEEEEEESGSEGE